MDHLTSPKLTPGVHCLSLRHKGMYVSYQEPEDIDAFNELYDSGCHWCGLTQTSFGPDGQPVRPDICQGDRGCCAH